MKKNIIIVTTTDFSTHPVGGKYESEEITYAFQANGYPCKLISADRLPFLTYLKEKIFRNFCKRVRKSLFKSYLSVGKAVANHALGFDRPDIVLSKDIFCSLYLQGKGIPIVQDVTSRISDSKYEVGRITKDEYYKMQLLEREVYTKASLVIAKDKRLKGYLKSYISPRKIHVLYPPIPDYFRRIKVDKRKILKNLFGLSITEEKIILYNPTRIATQKGFTVIEELTHSLPQYKFLVTLKTERMNSLNTIATGILDRRVLPKIYSVADLVLVPSLRLRGHAEGISQIAIEAMLCGTPVIASDVGGLKEHETNIMLVRPTPADFLEAIKNFFQEGKDPARFESARRYATRFYSSVYIKKYMKVIEKVAQR